MAGKVSRQSLPDRTPAPGVLARNEAGQLGVITGRGKYAWEGVHLTNCPSGKAGDPWWAYDPVVLGRLHAGGE